MSASDFARDQQRLRLRQHQEFSASTRALFCNQAQQASVGSDQAQRASAGSEQEETQDALRKLMTWYDTQETNAKRRDVESGLHETQETNAKWRREVETGLHETREPSPPEDLEREAETCLHETQETSPRGEREVETAVQKVLEVQRVHVQYQA